MPSTGSLGGRASPAAVEAAGARGARFVVVVPPGRPEVYEQLTSEMAGEDIRVVIDRRLGDRRNHPTVPPVDRRRTYRRGTTALSMTPACMTV